MPPAKSRTNRALVAVGLVSSICAAVATYLYFSINTASISASPHFLPATAIDYNEIYIALYVAGNKESTDEDSLQERCSYLLKHETVPGLTHIARHVSPDLVILLPSMSATVKVGEIKDWVGKVASLDNSSAEATGNVNHFSHNASYADVIGLP
ncbi:protein of unknown function [Taphrina deformans PYCC 5710]|uniref:Uncharacterized protein n=1 Tax=Taphrina deformans (strain PYCC 5710 / ATCC 11124 / CBS 356.35 / IMI 108563 / JCM 9778 / NBRC 8474) TaxID=1097556 RepID=R4XDY9_TAPDE|nr:protein of unknown function [Taphrina deformans PYCC 5710]|eukprot:CCG83872.1 protein of unknown function [Taphrina deformans PYCC 5710]